MATYHFYKEGYAVPYDTFGHVVLRRNVDVPAIIASGVAGVSPLAVSAVRTALPAAGFVAAADVLQLFRVPAGFLMLGGGFVITTAGLCSDADIGNVSTTQTMLATDQHARHVTAATFVTAGYFNFDGADADEWVAVTGQFPITTLYITTGSIDITFNTVDETDLIADFWVHGCKVY